MAEKKTYICHKCQVPLETKKVSFTYLGHNFQAEMPACPSCGQVLIPEELVKGRMAQVEMMLEDK